LGFCLFVSFSFIPLASSKHGGCRELSAMQHRERMPVVSVFSVRAESASLLEPTFFNYPSSSIIKTRVFLQPAFPSALAALRFRFFFWSNRHRLHCSEYEIDILSPTASSCIELIFRRQSWLELCLFLSHQSFRNEWEREKQNWNGMVTWFLRGIPEYVTRTGQPLLRHTPYSLLPANLEMGNRNITRQSCSLLPHKLNSKSHSGRPYLHSSNSTVPGISLPSLNLRRGKWSPAQAYSLPSRGDAP
jgi:hypothetical protein